ncbi:NAD-dependent succinate-semialdehyde dehydrogenase [Leucobacter luti]|uniref:Succinate-semialdehyde dehydrogenase/glutarate-semialdehyde dehydrogenase n=1 Tax=Leucobacter luti TaxID=340320 RepID=A0A4Q7U3R7_9MICO|nr:NAD-dependent succinate-semialdehyde dehydrogenase [Leucobacter luti]MBL3700782.1 NAD-dependent succinate-semialdehyde dehydrogenase [Leucobacter luti]RZT68381.1 succinate-semialdehyde dehydrogenase/glutarate-semialdehyde dehydrogenase [Leucobacter luti]
MHAFPTIIPGRLFIDGEWRTGATGATTEVFNPATEIAIGTIEQASPEDVADGFAAAERGLAVWRNTDAWTRSATIRRVADILREWAPEASRLMTDEQGKPVREAEAEWLATADQFDWYADEARRIYGRTVDGHSTANRIIVRREPVGVVAAFAAWNFPALLPARKIAPALAAGCSVILRPTEEAPFSSLLIVRACELAGVPAGVITALTGPASRISEQLINSGIVRKLSLTGSGAVGRTLLHLAADNLVAVSMELGGHAPVLVFEDADVEAAARACVASKFRNTGQVCASPSRFIVQDTVAQRFTEAFIAATRELQLGDGHDPETTVGPLSNRRQIAQTEALVADAVSAGATVALGGQRDPRFEHGYFFEPTVLVNVPPHSKILSDEPFAPVAPIVTFDSFEQAIEIANSTVFGLASYVWTTNLSTAFLASERIEAGMVGVNTMAVATAEAPFGGVKESGFGREGGSEGILDYTVAKATILTL